MKARLLISALIAVALFSSATAFGQDVLDSLFYRDGRIEGVTVSKSTSELIQFSYPNEMLVNEIQKADLTQIKYSSGRVEQLSTIEDALPIPEPEFVGEVYLVKENNEYALLDKEIPRYKQGPHHNKIKIKGAMANLQADNKGELIFIVRSTDNQSDPASIITIYKLGSREDVRVVSTARRTNRSYTTLNKSQMPFTAVKYGKSSYLVTAADYENGEYAITVYNPNSVDEKKTVFNCISIGEKVVSDETQSKFDGGWIPAKYRK